MADRLFGKGRQALFAVCTLVFVSMLTVVCIPAFVTAQEPDPASLAITGAEIGEEDGGTTLLRFVVTRSGDTSQHITVNFRSGDGTATGSPVDTNACPNGADYVRPQTSGGALARVDLFAGVTQAFIDIIICSDNIDEVDETFEVVLVDTVPVGVAITQARATGTIRDDDTPPTLRIDNVTVAEAANVVARFTVSLSAPSGKDVLFDFITANGTSSPPARGGATCGANVDFVTTSGTNRVFTAGTTNPQVIEVRICADAVDEVNETFFVNLRNVRNATPPSPRGTGTISDDDAQPTATLANVTLQEGDSPTTPVNMQWTVRLSAASGRSVTVSYATSANAGGLAATPSPDAACSRGEDFLNRAGTVTFVPAANGLTPTTRTFTVPICGDLLDEENETFRARLTTANGATLGAANAVGTINDNDPLPRLFISSQQVNEGIHDTVRPAILLATLRDVNGNLIDTGRTVSFTVRTETGTDTSSTDPARGGADCNTPFVDYVDIAGRQEVIEPGRNREIITTAVCGDLDVERGETFRVIVENLQNAVLANGVGVVTILSDDGPSLTIDDAQAAEGNVITFTVTLRGEAVQPVRATFSTTNNTARTGTLFASTNCETITGQKLPNDYQQRVTTVEFPISFADSQTRQVVVNTCEDSQFENDETFTARLENVEFAALVDSRGVGTIRNDDPCDIEGNGCVTGVPSLAPANASVEVGQRLHYDYTWTVPEGRVWRDLDAMELRLRDGDDIAMWLRWDETADTFCLIDLETGACGQAMPPGTPTVLAYDQARLYLAETSVQGSGPDGPSVTLKLSLSFDPGLAGRTFIVEAAAEDDLGNEDLFTPVGSVTVVGSTDDQQRLYLPLVQR